MNGIIKKIKNVFPVTTTRAVYLDGTNKTLQQAIDNKELGGTTTATTSGRGYCQIKLRGNIVFIDEVVESSSSHTRISYKFPNGDSDRLRRMYAYAPSGTMKNIDIPDGTLALNEGLVYDFDTNTLLTKTGSWGNISVANNEVLLLYNDYYGCVNGALSPYIETYNQQFIPTRYLDFNVCSTTGNGLSQGIFIIDDYMYCWGHSSDDRVTLGNFRKCPLNDLNTISHTGSHNLGHMNAPSYCHVRDMMIVGNGSKIYDQTSFPMAGYIFKNFKSILESNPSNLDFNTLDKITLDLSQFTGEYKAQLCWGEENTDYVYLLTCENTIIRKLLLGKTVDGDYDGSYTVIKTYKSTVKGITGGFKYYNGCLYTGIKGEYGIRKMKLCDNTFDSTLDGIIYNEYIPPINKSGDMQGIDIKDGYMFAYTDSEGYKISVDKI